MVKASKNLALFVLVFCFALYPQGFVSANPQGGTVVGGSAGPFNYSGDTLTVTQTSDRLAVEWDSFSIGQPEAVTFIQPAISSIVLNRVTGVDPSLILGSLSANGRLFLINPNGVVFGANAVVDTAGLLASTLELDMSVADFIAGSHNFTFSGPGGSVVNYGKISLNQPGGFVALLGSSVKNVGLVEANLGKVILAAGEQMTLDLDPDGLISVAVNITQGTDRNDHGEYAAVNNAGTIIADGGKVVLSADILDSVFTSAVNNDGIIEANAVAGDGVTDGFVLVHSNQNIKLNGTIATSGAIDAYAKEDIILGQPIEEMTLTNFSWRYFSGDRYYPFKEFGYYYGDGDVRVILSRGQDIGKDLSSPLSGAGTIALPGEPVHLYTIFDTKYIDNMGLVAYFQDPLLNPDGLSHVVVDGTEYSWEDMYHQGDKDFNDTIVNFETGVTTIESPSALLSAPNIFLTAENGSIAQSSGDIYADNLMLSSNTGVSGTGGNGGIATNVSNFSALNKTSGHIRVSNSGRLTVADLSGVNGLNPGVTGHNGVTNNAVGGEVNLDVKSKGEDSAGDLNVEAPVDSYGPVIFTAAGNIMHTALGDVTIHNSFLPGPVTNLTSPSHTPGETSDDRTVEITWGLPEKTDGYSFTGEAGGEYAMAPGSEIKTQGGDLKMTAEGDITLSLIDAQNANAEVTSKNGSIVDGDLGVVPGDYDVIAHNIKLSAVNGSVGGPADQEEIDLGHPYEFSYLWDHLSNADPDVLVDPYDTVFNAATGNWQFGTVSDTLADGQWWFHVAAIDDVPSPTISSPTSNIGPFVFGSTPSNTSFWEKIEKEFRVYYEILDPSQFLSFEPATRIGLYAYHPLTPMDSSAFDDIKLDADAYEFIEDNIKSKKPMAPYFGLQKE